MKILIVSATRVEISPLLEKFKAKRKLENIFTFRLGRNKVEVLITGVGMTATAFHLGKILNKNYNLAINAGIAGSFRKNIPLGTVVNVVSDCFADFGAEDGEKFFTLEGWSSGGTEEWKNGRMEEWKQPNIPTFHHSHFPLIHTLPKVSGITVNTVHGNTASIVKVRKKFNPDIESMEGAAFFFACEHEKIPCIQIRSISNYVERRNKKKWKMKLAVKNLCITIEKILKKYLFHV